jgi:hypothetical protein
VIAISKATLVRAFPMLMRQFPFRQI